MVRVIPLPLTALLLLASVACGDVLDRIALPEPTPAAIELSLTIAEPPADLPPYDRDDWRHWTDDDSDCQDTRQEVLVAESASQVVFDADRQCRVESGHWFDPYTGQVYTDPGDLDIDHLVPLANAHRSGGWAWSSGRKRQFANSLGDPAHLIAVSASANREKGARGPEEWRPPRTSYWCSYATAWARVKRAWDLTATRMEAEALREMLRTCDGPVSFEASGEVPITVAPQPTPLPPGTYASCAEADASGEPRVKGAQGEGWGFLASLLPNSRDGDGDGVVCEVTPLADEQPVVETATPEPLPSATPTFVPSATPPPRKIYDSCEEAEVAGEERVQGYIGGGLGFAAEVVPSARDGDSDGIVCEVAGPAPVVPTPPPAPPDSTATPAPAAPPTPTPTVAPDRQGTYASCDEAEAAGEPRVRGSSGPGRGFPAELVPSARDGDGDGVVCER